jgi:tripartite-type tricarboxylate transporter receptor subunit TctC
MARTVRDASPGIKGLNKTGGTIMRIPALICGVALLAAPAMGPAQDFPNKPMRLVVPAGTGGSADLLARLVADGLKERLNNVVIVENRPGAGQMIGSEHVARSDPDGHTILLVTVTYTTSSAIYPKLGFNPLTDLQGVAMLGSGPMLLITHPSVPAKSVKELIALARAKPGQLDIASAGNGTIPHLLAELFMGNANINLVHVPYKGIAAAVTAVVAGEVPILFSSTPASRGQVEANRVRVLAQSTAIRSKFLPDVPTLQEAGVPDFDEATWWGILAPGKTPQRIVDRLNAEIQAIVASKEFILRLEANGAEPVHDMSAQEFTALLKKGIANWRRIVKERNLSIK